MCFLSFFPVKFYLTRGSHDFGMEKTAASWQKGFKVSVCCLLPGTRFGVYQEMVSFGNDF